MRLAEVYKSVQGEGPRVGRPTVFVRTAGCNLRCPLWPCDTEYAINPKKFRSQWQQVGWTSVVDDITIHMIDNICFTGGEPMLQYVAGLRHVITRLREAGYHLEMFSNGTLAYPTGVVNHVDIVMDWKLPGSGEADIKKEVRWSNLERMVKSGRGHVVKFTIANREDFDYARDIYDTMLARYGIDNAPAVYCGVVWGKVTDEQLIRWMLEANLDWIFNMQIHKHIWEATKGV